MRKDKVFYLNSLIETLRKKGYAHYIKDKKVDDFIGHIKVVRDQNKISIDVGVSDDEVQYYIETYVNDELVYEHGTRSIRIVLYQVDKTFNRLKK